MNGNVAAGQKTARRITVAHVEREEVVRAGISIIGDIYAETDPLPADLGRSGEVSLIVIEAEACDLHSVENEWRAWIAVAEATNQLRLLFHLLELNVQLECGLTTFSNLNRACSINIGRINWKRRRRRCW